MKKSFILFLVGFMFTLILSGCAKNVKSIILDKSVLTVEHGNTFALTCTIMPNDVDDKSIAWNIGTENVSAKTNENTPQKEFLASKVGSAKIKVVSSNGLEAECQVTVTENAEDKVAREKVAADAKAAQDAKTKSVETPKSSSPSSSGSSAGNSSSSHSGGKLNGTYVSASGALFVFNGNEVKVSGGVTEAFTMLYEINWNAIKIMDPTNRNHYETYTYSEKGNSIFIGGLEYKKK